VKESFSSSPLELDTLRQRLQEILSEDSWPCLESVETLLSVPDIFLEGIRAGKSYTEHIKIVPIGRNKIQETHSYTENPMPEDELPDEEWEAFLRDADVRVEATDPEQPDNGQCRVTFLPEGVTVDVDLFAKSNPFKIRPENRNRVLRERATFRDYGEVALYKVEDYLEQIQAAQNNDIT